MIKILECYGLECATEEEAWKTFRQNSSAFFYCTSRHKYWRTIPRLFKDIRYDENRTVYLVKARVLATIEPIKGVPEADLDNLPSSEDECGMSFECAAAQISEMKKVKGKSDDK